MLTSSAHVRTETDFVEQFLPVIVESQQQFQSMYWKLHSILVAQIWSGYGWAELDLFMSEVNTQCHIPDLSECPVGGGCLGRQWLCVLLYTFPPLELITSILARVWEWGHTLILMAPHSAAVQPLVAPASLQGSPRMRFSILIWGTWSCGPGP